VIVRLMGEGQYRVDEALLARLNEVDNETVRAVERADQQAVREQLERMVTLVRAQGERLSDDYLGASELLIPPADLTLDEARALFQGDGLIPDLPG
jgi:hypothetical protein